MTMPVERARAVINTHRFLIELSSPYNGGLKGVRREIRQRARALLRHYPGVCDMKVASESCPETFSMDYGYDAP